MYGLCIDDPVRLSMYFQSKGGSGTGAAVRQAAWGNMGKVNKPHYTENTENPICLYMLVEAGEKTMDFLSANAYSYGCPLSLWFSCSATCSPYLLLLPPA